ncbi:DUF4190 domain-containing protein [Quadrisphaera sp. INWT6]|uniref:DUF4190 domain-containing protein n=1 Tax=Quadrisphaera sp. INWT6 TaxID=2596917 RepID=UPI0018922559|nr:DUF4190 domain-containing protein [Quadrisphaera sp. INWT6]
MSQPPTGCGDDSSLQHPPPTETTAVLALVFAFVFAPLGIVFGVIARRSVRQNGTQGHELATAGLWISVVITALAVVAFVALVVVPFVSLLLFVAVAGSTAP